MSTAPTALSRVDAAILELQIARHDIFAAHVLALANLGARGVQ